MNPFTERLNRIGFMFWLAICFLLAVLFGAIIDATKMHHTGVYWLPFRIIWFVGVIALFLLICFRRLQSSGLRMWLLPLLLVPYLWVIIAVILMVVPPDYGRTRGPGRSLFPRTRSTKVSWIIYLVFLVGISVAALFSYSRISLVDVLDIIAILVAVAAVAALVYKPSLLPKQAWYVLAGLLVIYHYVYTFVLDGKFGATPSRTSSDYLVTAFFPLPLFAGLCLLALSAGNSVHPTRHKGENGTETF